MLLGGHFPYEFNQLSQNIHPTSIFLTTLKSLVDIL
jgi:hypothetical protein